VTLWLHFRLKKASGLCCIIVGGGRPWCEKVSCACFCLIKAETEAQVFAVSGVFGRRVVRDFISVVEGCDVSVRASIERRRDCEGLKTDSKSFFWGRSFGAEVFAVCVCVCVFFPL
jgi:hypothetical protein